MANTPKAERHKHKTVAMLKRWADKAGYTMIGPHWVDGIPHMAFKKKEDE